MTATRPTQSQSTGNVLSKRTRGPINKRACQRCRQGKIKCDGDAESGKACSNCDPQHCKYDNSPRKNKQVESLKLRLTAVEEQLLAITNEFGEQLNTKDSEKEIICRLYEAKDRFMNYDSLFIRLRDALKQSRFNKTLLPIIFELLRRIGESENSQFIPNLMESLQRLVDSADSTFGNEGGYLDAFSLTQSYSPAAVDPMVSIQSLPLQQINNNTEVDMSNLNLHSGDDDSETNSGGYEYNDDASGNTPTTPEGHHHHHHHHNHHHNHNHSESKCFDNSNNNNNGQRPVPSQQPIIATTTSPDLLYTQYYPVMDNNNYALNFIPTTTSPTDEWSVNMNTF